MKEREGEKRSKEGRREKEETKFFTSCDTVTLYTHNIIMDRTTSHTNKTVLLYKVDYNHSSVGLLWHSTEVYPAEKNGQHYTIIMQHSLGNTVVHRLRKGEGKREQRRKVSHLSFCYISLHACAHIPHQMTYTLSTQTWNRSRVIMPSLLPWSTIPLRLGFPLRTTWNISRKNRREYWYRKYTWGREALISLELVGDIT